MSQLSTPVHWIKAIVNAHYDFILTKITFLCHWLTTKEKFQLEPGLRQSGLTLYFHPVVLHIRDAGEIKRVCGKHLGAEWVQYQAHRMRLCI